LAYSDVDADDVLTLLIDDGVEGDGGLAGAAVADDELALPPADGDHGVDGLDARLQRLFDRLTTDDTRSLELHRAELGRLHRALVVERHAERIDHAADKSLAHRHLDDSAGPLDLIALLDEGVLAHQHRADAVFLQVEHQTHDVVGELEHLGGDRIL
jgi:hypothetical protein